ncbi:MAG: hypothetical protein ACI4RG_05925 [Huintestinicola sp.]
MADNKMEVILLTESQVYNLIKFFELEFIPIIQKGCVDNITYICDMCDVYKKLKDAKIKFGDGEDDDRANQAY